jgi:hypothetical protein
MKQRGTIAEFWSPLLAQTQLTFDIYCYFLIFIVIYLLQKLFSFSTIHIAIFAIVVYFQSTR